MKIILLYIVVTGGPKTEALASRFVATHNLFPPGNEHETVVICNGGAPPLSVGLLFLTLPCTFYPRTNDGWDIGAYLDAARVFTCDMLVCLGESVFFHRAGWLSRLVETWNERGPGMYGLWSSNLVRPHLNTTGFAVDPALLRAWPKVNGRRDRYLFEHGPHSFWKRVRDLGRPVRLVTWDGDYGPTQWRQPDNILWRGDQSNCLAFCSHSENYRTAPLETQRVWSRHADQLYRE